MKKADFGEQSLPGRLPGLTSVMPLLAMFWLAGYFFFPTNKLHYQFFILIFVVGALLLGFQRQVNWRQLSGSRLLQLLAVFSSYHLLSLFWSFNTPLDDRVGEIKSVVYLLCFTVIMRFSLSQSSDYLSRLFKVLIAVSTLSLIASLCWFFLIESQTLASRFHGIGRLWNPLWMGAIYGALTIILIGLLSFASLSRRQMTTLLLLVALMFAGVVATHSRMAIVATLLVGFLCFLMSAKTWKTKALVTSSVVVVLSVAIWTGMPYFKKDIERGQSHRLNIWNGAVELIQEKPLFGYGAGSDTPIESTVKRVDGWHYYHNTYLATLVDLGVAGFLLMISILAYAVMLAWRMRDILAVRLSAYVLIYSGMISLTFGEGIISRMNVQWVLVWLPIILISHYEMLERRRRSD
ncbi:O-antigen ligase family protein [uncultured Methylophaga sp.]|uniref:O-antigen ligase family protein n=1 Tax=uncultured Methylophaga sp. TaxID=285271 RepID=UPI0026357AA5|nr:O-antigen ligase family protein [uncultured Methylophaga sp.]